MEGSRAEVGGAGGGGKEGGKGGSMEVEGSLFRVPWGLPGTSWLTAQVFQVFPENTAFKVSSENTGQRGGHSAEETPLECHPLLWATMFSVPISGLDPVLCLSLQQRPPSLLLQGTWDLPRCRAAAARPGCPV